MTQSQTVTHSHKQELVLLCTEVYRTPSHKFIKMTVTEANATISLMQPNDTLMGCRRILGLTALNSLLQYANWLVWEVCSVN